MIASKFIYASFHCKMCLVAHFEDFFLGEAFQSNVQALENRHRRKRFHKYLSLWKKLRFIARLIQALFILQRSQSTVAKILGARAPKFAVFSHKNSVAYNFFLDWTLILLQLSWFFFWIGRSNFNAAVMIWQNLPWS